MKDIGKPVKIITKTPGPMPERFLVVACSLDGDGIEYWKVWNAFYFEREAAEYFASKLPSKWIERRVYRIGDNLPE